jgi:hypothetical protein
MWPNASPRGYYKPFKMRVREIANMYCGANLWQRCCFLIKVLSIIRAFLANHVSFQLALARAWCNECFCVDQHRGQENHDLWGTITYGGFELDETWAFLNRQWSIVEKGSSMRFVMPLWISLALSVVGAGGSNGVGRNRPFVTYYIQWVGVVWSIVTKSIRVF